MVRTPRHPGRRGEAVVRPRGAGARASGARHAVEGARAVALVVAFVGLVAAGSTWAVARASTPGAGGDRNERAPAAPVARPPGRPVGGVTVSATRGGQSQPPASTAQAGAGGAPVTPPQIPGPGSLPQTHVMPQASGLSFDLAAQGLWAAIVDDEPSLGMAFFFPLSAYLQVKAISDPAADWHNRLVADYAADISSDHAALGPDPATASFVGIRVPESAAQWIVPGVEYNKGSYYRVYGATLDYTLNGRTGSIRIASMISWRGQWYVVHLASIR